jgi:hypothetical protein
MLHAQPEAVWASRERWLRAFPSRRSLLILARIADTPREEMLPLPREAMRLT